LPGAAKAGPLALLGLLACSHWAQAQGQSAPALAAAEQSPLEEVVVTASRRESRLQDVAAAITRVDQQALLQRAPDVLAAALRGQPGAFFQQTTPGQGIPIIRGLKGSQVLHLVDGMRVNNAFFRDAPNQYLALVDPFVAERIELVRGAAGSLFGADAMGGVVNILGRETRFSGRQFSHQGRFYGAYDSVNEGLTLRADAASGRDGLSLAGGVSWQDIGDRTIGGGETLRPSGYRSEAADLKVLADIGARGELMLSAQVLEQPSTPRIDELLPGFGQAEPPSRQFFFQPNRRSFLHARYRLQGMVRWYEQLELNLARQTITDDRLTQDRDSSVVNREQNQSELDGFTLQLNQAAGDAWLLTWGAELYRDSVDSARQLTNPAGEDSTATRPRFPDSSSMDSNAVYLAGNWLGPSALGVDLGLRYSWFDIHLPGSGDEPTVDLDPADLTGDLRLTLALSDTIKLVSNIGRGFRPPNVFDLGTLGPRPGNRFNEANPNLGPETVWSYDLGLKGGGHDWQFELFAFYLDYRDKITSVVTGEVTPDGRIVVRSENRNSVELVGLEAAASWQWRPRLRAFASLNYTYGEEMDGDTGVVPADRIPPVNGRAGLDWAPGSGLEISPYLLFAGAQSRLSPRDEADPRINPDGTAGWATVNLAITWQAREAMQLGLRLENLADRQYREHGSGIDAAGRNIGLWANIGF
jgi:outer membrane receptor protein involved in Fe transport